MNLLDIVDRAQPPKPWAEGEKIPWHDPAFSQRMLQEHLSQYHDAASRRFDKIALHVAWIHNQLLATHPARVLDLGCGPGLYTSRLARLGHECTGIDFSPASIAYARRTAQEENLSCTYIQQDVRIAGYGIGYSLAMLIFGEFNVFRPEDARHILRKAHDALLDGGTLLLEPHTFAAVEQIGRHDPSWYSAAQGLFSERPHLCLTESSWDPDTHTTTNRYLVVDVTTAEVAWFADTMQAYTQEQYNDLLTSCGFTDVTTYPSLTGEVDEQQQELFALVARKASE